MDKISEIRGRAEKATPGPWERNLGFVNDEHGGLICSVLSSRGKFELEIVNADFIAHSREDVPFLLDRLTALQQKNAALKAERDEYHDKWAKQVSLCTLAQCECDELKKAYDTNAEIHQKLTEDYAVLKAENRQAKEAQSHAN